jgi:hypothetical protein
MQGQSNGCRGRIAQHKTEPNGKEYSHGPLCSGLLFIETVSAQGIKVGASHENAFNFFAKNRVEPLSGTAPLAGFQLHAGRSQARLTRRLARSAEVLWRHSCRPAVPRDFPCGGASGAKMNRLTARLSGQRLCFGAFLRPRPSRDPNLSTIGAGVGRRKVGSLHGGNCARLQQPRRSAARRCLK